jgi:MFS family permease
MQHSHEALDRPGGLNRVGSLAPLRHRDFRLLWSGMCVSLLGDGAFLVAMAWQVYALSNVPTALAAVGIAMTIPTIVFLLVGGVVSDRYDRRRVMLAADAARGAVVGTLAILSLTGALRLWHIVALVAVYGAAQAFFDPSFDAIVPEVLPAQELGQANALDQIVRPLALRLAGPAIGGVLVDVVGGGGAFALDATTFAASALALSMMRTRGRVVTGAGPETASVRQDLGEGLRYVRAHAWLWATFAAAAIAYLLFMGPTEVLVPYIVKNQLHGSAGDLGLVFGAGGLGSIGCALVMGQRALPRATIVFISVVWALATVAVAGYGLADAVWQLMLVSVAFNVLESAGTIVWATAKQRHVPTRLLGRVSSLDWLISIGLLPLSFALTGPVAAALGVRTTMIGAGLLGAVVTLAALLVPGVRRVDGETGAVPPQDPPPAQRDPDARAARPVSHARPVGRSARRAVAGGTVITVVGLAWALMSRHERAQPQGLRRRA